jgi:hypothetical protein
VARSRVSVLRTAPATVIDDYKRLILGGEGSPEADRSSSKQLRLADYQRFLPKDNETALKINVSWHYFYPGCSTTCV